MYNPVINEIAYAFFDMEYHTLRFNYRGVDGSQGTITDNPEKCLQDYSNAVKHLLETSQDERVVAVGYSYGSYISYLYQNRFSNVKKNIFVSPTNLLYDFDFNKIEKPTLIIVGEDDEFANIKGLVSQTENNNNIRTEIIRETDHFYIKNLNKISEIIKEWIQR